MLSSELDVVARPQVYSGGYRPDTFDNLENKSVEGVTHVVQYCLPTEWRRYGTMRHIGYVEIESYDIRHSIWVDYFSMVDEIWCPNSDGAETIRKVFSGPVHVVPHAVDTSVYKKDYKISEIPEVSGTFKFLCVSENNPRKNLGQLIYEFWGEFDPTEPVSLILKTDSSVNDLINHMKIVSRIYKQDVFQKIMLIDNRLSKDEMMGLYKYCNCYVSSSMGESLCLPIVHSMGFDKPIISINRGGPKDILSGYEKFTPIGSDKHGCESSIRIPGYQDGRDYWYKPNHESIGEAMRSEYNMRGIPESKSNNIYRFSDQKFIERVKELFG